VKGYIVALKHPRGKLLFPITVEPGIFNKKKWCTVWHGCYSGWTKDRASVAVYPFALARTLKAAFEYDLVKTNRMIVVVEEV